MPAPQIITIFPCCCFVWQADALPHRRVALTAAPIAAAAFPGPLLELLLIVQDHPWCKRFDVFGKMHRLSGVPVITVQLRYPGWVTELGPNPEKHGKHGSNPAVPQRLTSDPADPNSAGRFVLCTPILRRHQPRSALRG